MDYLEAIHYIKNIERAGSDYGIERMRELLDILDSVDEKLRFIHIAGTNGKGSVTSYLTSILKSAGYKVGTYNSPSVFKYNERWLINGEPLSDEDVAKYLSVVKDAIDGEREIRKAFHLGEFNPTAFEIETAVAMLAFSDKECDVCVLETGLGGKWDATNAIYKKELAVITRIGLDHTQLLGNTLGLIAKEKAAIIKKDVVTCSQPDEVMNEILNPTNIIDGKEITFKSSLHLAEKAKPLSYSIDGQEFEYKDEKYFISMLGDHQLENAAIAIEAALFLKDRFNIDDKDIKEGMKNARWGARFEVVQNAKERFNIVIPEDKTLIFDGSHNPQGAKTLRNSIEKYFGCKVHLVLGILKDKDVDGVLDELLNVTDRVTTITPPSPRALDREELKEKIEKRNLNIKVDTIDNIKDGVRKALEESKIVVLCGSLTLFEVLNG